MNDSSIQPTAEKPDNIAEQTEATGIVAVTHYFFTKWKKYKLHQFKTLEAPWNTNYGNAKNKSSEKISQCCKETAEYQPNKVAQ